MNIQIEINSIKKELEEMQDENLIQTIKSLLKFARKKSFNSKLKPISVKEYRTRAETSEKNIKAGFTKGIDTLDKESDSW